MAAGQVAGKASNVRGTGGLSTADTVGPSVDLQDSSPVDSHNPSGIFALSAVSSGKMAER